jgi:ABC-2 type transport system ATP-binding protein
MHHPSTPRGGTAAPADTAPAIAVEQLRKSYKDVDVLKGVTFAVDEGSVFALLGSNGAGKTTTINILTTLVKADGGTATVAGFDVGARPANVREHISLTGQFAAVDNRLTARENLVLIGDLRHVGDPAATAADLLERFGLLDAADRSVATFSGGMRRRLDIAMSLIGRPEVIFLDEPTTGFDPEARIEMWKLIRRLADDGTTVFLTTQHLEEADQLADRIAVLHRGEIVASGSAAELKKLVPGGMLELTFRDNRSLEEAARVLAAHSPAVADDGLTLSVSTDGTVASVADVFTLLRDARIEPLDFTQRLVTLEDVFLTIIAEEES